MQLKHFAVKPLNQSAFHRTICGINIQMHAKHTHTKNESDKKPSWTRHPISEREGEGEGGKRGETQGAGPTCCGSSQLRSREVTMASDKQSAIDHPSLRRSPAPEAAENRVLTQRARGRQRARCLYASAPSALLAPFLCPFCYRNANKKWPSSRFAIQMRRRSRENERRWEGCCSRFPLPLSLCHCIIHLEMGFRK